MAKVKRLLSREELENLLYSPEVRTAAWIRDENQRKLTYRELISCGDRVRLAAMVHAIYRHKAVQLAAGKRCHISDENFLRDAEKMLSGEIAAVMGLEPEEARAFLRQKLMGE